MSDPTPITEDLAPLWKADFARYGWDPGPIPIITSPPASTWIWSDLYLSDRGTLEAFGRPFAEVPEDERVPTTFVLKYTLSPA